MRSEFYRMRSEVIKASKKFLQIEVLASSVIQARGKGNNFYGNLGCL